MLIFAVLVLIWSGISPKDTFTWYLEVAPSLVGLPLLLWFDKRYGVNMPLYVIACIHSAVLSVGGHYTYAEVPIGFWIQDLFHFTRNHYDRLGHFFQGITPALVAFEYFSRARIVTSQAWLRVLCVCVALSFSALYEFIEWWTALLTGEGATAFLGTQGDVWDTQWDMFLAMCGAIVAAAGVTLSSRRTSREALSTQPPGL